MAPVAVQMAEGRANWGRHPPQPPAQARGGQISLDFVLTPAVLFMRCVNGIIALFLKL